MALTFAVSLIVGGNLISLTGAYLLKDILKDPRTTHNSINSMSIPSASTSGGGFDPEGLLLESQSGGGQCGSQHSEIPDFRRIRAVREEKSLTGNDINGLHYKMDNILERLGKLEETSNQLMKIMHLIKDSMPMLTTAPVSAKVNRINHVPRI